MAKQEENNPNIINRIGVLTKIIGDINTEADIRIDGSLKGNLSTTGKLIIGSKGKIEGDIICTNAEIEGVFEGKINVSELLTLKSTSSLSGEVTTGQLMIETGANFSGNCKMNNTIEKKSK